IVRHAPIPDMQVPDMAEGARRAGAESLADDFARPERDEWSGTGTWGPRRSQILNAGQQPRLQFAPGAETDVERAMPDDVAGANGGVGQTGSVADISGDVAGPVVGGAAGSD